MIGTALLTLLALTGQTAPSQDARQATFAIQVALDRAGFSTGVIDGRMGANTRRAIDAYRQRHGAEPSPFPDPLLEYRITAEDEAGPFVSEIPTDLVEQSKLPALAYRSVVEALAERFHTTPEVLRELNASASFTAGASIRVPNVEPLVVLGDARDARTSEGRFERRGGPSRRHERSVIAPEERQAGRDRARQSFVQLPDRNRH